MKIRLLGKFYLSSQLVPYTLKEQFADFTFRGSRNRLLLSKIIFLQSSIPGAVTIDFTV